MIATFDMTDAVNLGVVGLTFPDVSVLTIGPWIGNGYTVTLSFTV